MRVADHSQRSRAACQLCRFCGKDGAGGLLCFVDDDIPLGMEASQAWGNVCAGDLFEEVVSDDNKSE